MKRKQPSTGLTMFLCSDGSSLNGSCGQSGKVALLLYIKLEGIGLLDIILIELQSQLPQFGLDFL